MDFVPRKAEPAQMALNGTAFPCRSQILDDLVNRLLRGLLRHVLPVVCDSERGPQAQRTSLGGFLPDDRAQKGGLARPVRPNEAHDITAHDTRVEVLDQRALCRLKRDPLGYQHLIAAPLARLQT